MTSSNITFQALNDSTSPNVTLSTPTSVEKLAASTTETFTVSFTTSDCSVDTCWYSYTNTSGLPGGNTTTTCDVSFDLAFDFFGSHTLTLYANDSAGNIGSDTVTFTVTQSTGSTSQPQGASMDSYVVVPLLVEEEPISESCGVDKDKDGYICDSNEDWISCPEDCEAPDWDSLFCLKPQKCIWTEAWFLKIMFGLLGLVTMYLLYLDVKRK